MEHGGVFLSPYNPSLPMFPECFWTRVYFLLKNEGLEDMFASPVTHDGFITYFSVGKFPIFAGKRTPDGWEEVAMAWLEPMIWTETAKVSRIHFFVFPRYRARRDGIIGCLLGLKYYFSRCGVDCLYGTFYQENVHAIRYADGFLGFSNWHRLPKFSLHNGKLEDMTVGTLLREDFNFDGKIGKIYGRRSQ